MRVYSDGVTRVIKGQFPKTFRLLNAGVEVPFIRTGKDSIRLSGEIPSGVLEVEEFVRQKKVEPAKFDAASLAIINKEDIDRIDVLNKKVALSHDKIHEHLARLTEHEATLSNLETQNAKAIEETKGRIVELAKAVGKEIQAGREKFDIANQVLISSIQETGNILSSKIDAHEKEKNPHKITKASIGLERVDNTPDLEKPVSKETKKALDKKADKVDLEEVKKSLEEAGKKQESIVKSIENSNLYGGVGGSEMPSGGKKGQALIKASNKDGDFTWGSGGTEIIWRTY